MCHENEPKVKAKKVTLIMLDRTEIGPVKVVGLSEVQSVHGPMLEADVYGGPNVVSHNPTEMRFMAVYTNFEHRKPKTKTTNR